LAPSDDICHSLKYYSVDGSCNNLDKPNWGRAKNPFGRVLASQYADGVSEPTRAIDGKRLPNARELSLLMFGENMIPHDKFTLAVMQFGQIVAHDLGHSAGSLQSKPHSIRCW
jgi:peroxidase